MPNGNNNQWGALEQKLKEAVHKKDHEVNLTDVKYDDPIDLDNLTNTYKTHPFYRLKPNDLSNARDCVENTVSGYGKYPNQQKFDAQETDIERFANLLVIMRALDEKDDPNRKENSLRREKVDGRTVDLLTPRELEKYALELDMRDAKNRANNNEDKNSNNDASSSEAEPLAAPKKTKRQQKIWEKGIDKKINIMTKGFSREPSAMEKDEIERIRNMAVKDDDAVSILELAIKQSQHFRNPREFISTFKVLERDMRRGDIDEELEKPPEEVYRDAKNALTKKRKKEATKKRKNAVAAERVKALENKKLLDGGDIDNPDEENSDQFEELPRRQVAGEPEEKK